MGIFVVMFVWLRNAVCVVVKVAGAALWDFSLVLGVGKSMLNKPRAVKEKILF